MIKSIADIDRYLLDIRQRPSVDETASKYVQSLLAEIKAQAVHEMNQEKAKACWCYETILTIQCAYLSAFEMMKAGSYYEAWCHLEKVEVGFAWLGEHFAWDDESYALSFIETHVRLYQSLYPYRYFVSPAILHLESVCSVCGERVSVRAPCGHRVGEIYDGEMCSHMITKIEVLEISIVDRPAHKYAVLFTNNEDSKRVDHHDYRLVAYVVSGLSSPFDEWSLTWSKIRHPHSYYEHVASTDSCPCGSGDMYVECCLQEEGVLRPHVDVHFSAPPPDSLTHIQYLY